MKKLVSLLAILILVFAIFAACNPDQITPKDSDDADLLPAPRLDVYDQNGTLLTVDIPLEFGKVLVGEPKKLEVKIHNAGGYKIYSPTIYVYEGSRNFVPEPIAIEGIPVGMSISNTIIYTPNKPVLDKAIIRIEGWYSTNPSGIKLYTRDFLVTGNGIIPAPIINMYHNGVLVNLENPVDFGKVLVGESKKLELVVKNEGTITLYEPFAYLGEIPPFPEWEITNFENEPLLAGESKTLIFTYSPNNKGKDFKKGWIFGFYTYDKEYFYYEFAGIGEGIYAPLIRVYNDNGDLITVDNPLKFGTVNIGDKKKLRIKITNEGNTTLQAPEIYEYVSSQIADIFSVDPIGIKSLSPKNSTFTYVYFKPKSDIDYKTQFIISGTYSDDDISIELYYSTLFTVIGRGAWIGDVE